MDSITTGDDADIYSWNSAPMIKSISNLLSEIIAENKAELMKSKGKFLIYNLNIKVNPPKNIFTSKKPPSISIQFYFERILKYSKIEESTLIITLIYIDKLCDLGKIQLTDFNIHRVILATIVLAIKYNEDDYYTNEYYAKVGGITLQEINNLELEAINLVNHSLFVEEEFFSRYRNYLKHYLK